MSGLIKRIIKLCVTVIGVAVIFMVAIASVFIATFDANQYKQDLSHRVRAETGRDLQFYGDVSLTFYPALGMKLGALSLSNPAGFGTEPMIKVNKVSISIDVASIIALSPEIDQLILDNLEINLQKNAKGATNWDDLIRPEKTQSSNTASESTQGNSNGEPTKVSGAFAGLNITNAQLSWMEAQADAAYQVQNLNIKTGRMTPDTPFALQMQVVLESKDDIKANVDLEAQMQYVFGKAQINITDLALNIADGTADDLAGLPIPFRIDGPFADPKIKVQLDGMLKRQIAQKAMAKAKLKAYPEAQKAEIAKQKAALQKEINAAKAKLKDVQKLKLENERKVLEAKAKTTAE